MPSTWTWTRASGRINLKWRWQGRSPLGWAPLQVFAQGKDANDDETGLLRTAGSAAEGERQRYPRSLSQAGAEISSRFESGRQVRGRKIQATTGSLRRPLRFQEAADVRPVRLLQR